jgi:hypothetical protein
MASIPIRLRSGFQRKVAPRLARWRIALNVASETALPQTMKHSTESSTSHLRNALAGQAAVVFRVRY